MGKLKMLYLVIERFKNRDAQAVYVRFREKGRMAPAGLAYVETWVDQLRSLLPADGVRRSALAGQVGRTLAGSG